MWELQIPQHSSKRAPTSERGYGGVGQLRAELAVHGDLIQLGLAADAGVIRVQKVRGIDLEAVEAPVRHLRLQPLRDTISA